MTAEEHGMAWRTIPSLVRVYLSLTVAFSALTGFVCFRHAVTPGAWAACAGVFLLACAASALNQYQEREFDALMDRTKNRPLPILQLGGRHAIGIALLLGPAGAILLYFGATPVAAFLGALTLFWYNFVYTPLKRKTRFSVFIGACTGALPPLIGYTAAGGPFIGRCLVISLFMFLWQVLHVQLLLVKYGREYESAGFPGMVSATNEKGVRILVLVCMTATVGAALALLAVRIVYGRMAPAALIAGSVLFQLLFYCKSARVSQTASFTSLFGSLYAYQGLVFFLIIGSALLNPR